MKKVCRSVITLTLAWVAPTGCQSWGKFWEVDNSCQTKLMGGASNCALSLNFDVSTFAGPAPGSISSGDVDLPVHSARFTNPYGITSDGTSLFVADSVNNKIRRIDIASGAVTTLAGQGQSFPGDADGPGAAASFNTPMSITCDGTFLYVTDTGGHKIRQIHIATGLVSTLAGQASGCGISCASGSTDSIGTTARFSAPEGITTDGTYLYIADAGNVKIRRMHIASKAVTTFAGDGTLGDLDGNALSARFNVPRLLTQDGENLYLADNGNNKIRRINLTTGFTSTLAGPAQGTTTAGDADGSGIAARFNSPYGITTDQKYLYVTDQATNKIRRVEISTATVITVAGPAQGCSPACTAGDTDGAQNSARFDGAAAITTDGRQLFLVEFNNNKIRKIN